MKPQEAFAKARQNGFTEELQEIACQENWSAFYFAKHVVGADITKCQQAACRYSYFAMRFAEVVPGADIEYCKQYMGEFLDPYLKGMMARALK